MSDKGNKNQQASAAANRYTNDYTTEIEDSRSLFEYVFLDLPMGLNRFGVYRGKKRLYYCLNSDYVLFV